MRQRLLLLSLAFLAVLQCNTQIIYTPEDSLKVINLLNKAKSLHGNINYPLFFGKELISTPYASGTLDQESREYLVINLHQLDCTTFIETIVALSHVAGQEKGGFKEFADALTKIRYHSGHMEGYASRLHYFSDWIDDNANKGMVRELSGYFSSVYQFLDLNYMSAHSELYKQLKDNPSLIEQIKGQEARLKGKKVFYLPKDIMRQPDIQEKIKDGSIIAITTNIGGLDVAHVGLAIKKNGKLHLLHASSTYGKVIVDTTPLDEYLKKTTLTGVRVVSIL